MEDINQQIEKILRKNIQECRNYLNETTIGESMQDYLNYIQDQTQPYIKENNPEDHWIIENNLNALESSKEIFAEALQNEAEYRQLTKRVIRYFDALKEELVTAQFIRQLSTALPKIKLKEGYGNIFGLFLEFDADPVFGVYCYPEQNFEVILKKPKCVDFENADWVSDIIVELDFSMVAQPIFEEEYTDMIDDFEAELDYFQNIKHMYLCFTYLCINKALGSRQMEKLMNTLPIHPAAIFYAGEHDMEERTIFKRVDPASRKDYYTPLVD